MRVVGGVVVWWCPALHAAGQQQVRQVLRTREHSLLLVWVPESRAEQFAGPAGTPGTPGTLVGGEGCTRTIARHTLQGSPGHACMAACVTYGLLAHACAYVLLLMVSLRIHAYMQSQAPSKS